MDRDVSIRFFDVNRFAEDAPHFSDALRYVFDSGTALERERELMPNYRLRLERLREQDGNLLGELTRIQTVNFPSEVRDDRTDPLPGDRPLGHGICFGFNPQSSILAFEWNIRIVSLSRFNDYLRATMPEGEFYFQPKLRTDAWARFDAGPIRKMRLQVASPANLDQLDDAGETVASSFRRMGRAYDAPYVTIEVSVGRRREPLNEQLKNALQSFVNFGQRGGADIRKATAVADIDGERQDREIDFIDEVMKKRRELPLPDRDPDGSYQVREAFLIQAMREEGFWR